MTKEEFDALKSYFGVLSFRMKERDNDCAEPKNDVDRGYSLAVEHMKEEMDQILNDLSKQIKDRCNVGQLLAFTENDERYKDVVNMEVIKFIDNITDFPDRSGKVSENINHLFCAGYCYYFANMLQLAFGGTVCWVQDRGHVVWLDGNDVFNDIAYDVTGVYTDYERLWPIEYLGDTVVNFLHNGKEFHLNDEFKEWCDSCGISETSAIETIWGCIPMDEIEECYKKGLNLVDTAYQFWSEYKVALKQIFIFNSNNPAELLTADHKGVRHLKAMVE